MRVVSKDAGLWRKDAEILYPEASENFKAFLNKHRSYRPPDPRFDVCGFARRVFAVHDALAGYEGIGVVLNGVKAVKKVPKGVLEKYLEGAAVAHFGRTGYFTDTNLILFDGKHPQTKRLLDAWVNWYLSERFKQGPQFHDGIAFDSVLKRNQIPANDMSGEFGKVQHPLNHSPLAGWFA